MTYLILGLVLLLGIHSISIIAPLARDRWVAAMGANTWRILYSVVSLVGLVLLIHGYGLARQDPIVLYWPPLWLRYLSFVLMLAVFPLVFATFLPGRIKSVVKHPMITAVKIWAVAHLLANGMAADLLLFGGFLAWAVADRISLKRRVVRPVRTAPPSPWNDAIAVVGGLAVYALVLWRLHQWVIGIPII